VFLAISLLAPSHSYFHFYILLVQIPVQHELPLSKFLLAIDLREPAVQTHVSGCLHLLNPIAIL